MPSGLLQHLSGVELVRPGDEPRQLGRLLADPLPALPRRRLLNGLARAAAGVLVGVRAAHEHEGLGNLRRQDRDHGRGRQWQMQDVLVVHQRHLLVATANALPLAGVLIGPGGAVARSEEGGGGGVAGRGQAEEVVERGVGGVERVVHEAEQRVGDLGVDVVVVVLEEAHVRRGVRGGEPVVAEQRGGCRVEAERHGSWRAGEGGCFALAACVLACVSLLRE